MSDVGYLETLLEDTLSVSGRASTMRMLFFFDLRGFLSDKPLNGVFVKDLHWEGGLLRSLSMGVCRKRLGCTYYFL